MKKIFGSVTLMLFLCFGICARAKYAGIAGRGGKEVKTATTISYKLLETYPNCTVTVYLTGTTTLATIYSNNSGSVQANPFNADSTAAYSFYADNGRYDIKFSGFGIPAPYTLADILLGGDSPVIDSGMYSSLCTAVSTIGATSTTLQITTNNFPSGGNCTVPSTLQLDFASSGNILMANGQTVFILSDGTKWPRRKIFYNAVAGGGTINFEGNYQIKEIFFEWWGAGPSFSAAINTPALQAGIIGAYGNTRTNGSGLSKYNRILCFLGTYDINDELKVYHMIGFRWTGENKLNSGIRQTATNKRIIDGQSIAYGVFEELNFSSSATQGAGIPLIDLNFDASQGEDLRSQNITFQDCFFAGGGFSLMGVWIARNGGGAQGDNIRFYNCYASGFTHSAACIGGNNTTPLTNSFYAYNGLNVTWEGGDIQGCPLYGLAAYAGNWVTHNVSMENSNGGVMVQTGWDIYCEAAQTICTARDIRSESPKFSNGVSLIENVSTNVAVQHWFNTNVSSPAPISAITNANPVVLTVPPNFWFNGNVVNIFGVTGTLGIINGPRVVTQITPTTFSIPINTTALSVYAGGATGQTAQFLSGQTYGVNQGISGSSYGGDGKVYVVTSGGTFGGLSETKALSGGVNTITVPGTPWTVNAFQNYKVTIMAGTGAPATNNNPFGVDGETVQSLLVSSNTNNTITTSTNWTIQPDSTSVFVVEPNWGTQFTSGTVTWALYDFIAVANARTIHNGLFMGGTLTFGASGSEIENLTISRADALPKVYDGSSFAYMRNVFIYSGPGNGVSPAATFKYFIPSFAGNLGGGLYKDYSALDLGTQKIRWSGALITDPNSRFSDLWVGRGDGIRGDDVSASGTTVISRNILGYKGTFGRETVLGTNVAGQNTDIQGGLPTGSGIPGNINLWVPAAIGSSGSTIRIGQIAAGISGRNGIFWTFFGLPVASATALTPSGNTFHVTGVTNITSIVLTGVPAGSELTLIFDGILTFTDGSNLKLAGNFVTTADDTITLVCDGTNCYEKARSIN